jgi:hypothetical protein
VAAFKQSLGRDALSLAVVLALVAAGLRLLDLLPQRLAEPRGGRPFADVGSVERRLGERLALPAYFPQTLRWPAARIRVAGARPALVVLAFEGSGAAGERLWLAQSVGGVEEPAAGLWPEGVLLEAQGVSLRDGTGTLERLLAPDGRIWQQLRWERWGRLLLLRSLGSPEELLLLARSVRKEGP